MDNPARQRVGQYCLFEPSPNEFEVFHAALLGRISSDSATQGPWRYREYIPSSNDTPISNSGSSMDGGDESWLRDRHHPQYTARPATLLPGQYHPRIWRNGW